MSTSVYRYINGDGSPIEWTPTPSGTPHYTKVDDDDTGEYITAPTTIEVEENFTFGGITGSPVGIIDYVKIGARYSGPEAGPRDINIYLIMDGNPILINPFACTTPPATWLYSDDIVGVIATNPMTSLAWTEDEVSGIGSNSIDGIRLISSTDAGAVDIAYLQLEIVSSLSLPDAPENLTAVCVKDEIPDIPGFSFTFI